MLSDNGGEFKNELAARVSKQFGFRQRFISPGHPQSNGLCERCNGVISTLLAKACADDVKMWDERVLEACFLYNAKKHSSTQVSPYKLVYGKNCITWDQRRMEEGNTAGDSTEFTLDDTEDRLIGSEDPAELRKMEQAREDVNSFAQKKQAAKNRQNKAQYDKRYALEQKSLRVGDFVLRKETQYAKKMWGRLQPKACGPFEVAKLTSRTVHIKETKTGEIVTGVTDNLLQKYNEPQN